MIHTSVSSNIVAGKKVGAMRRVRDNSQPQIKRVLPLQEGDMKKAKACEEMILYEQIP